MVTSHLTRIIAVILTLMFLLIVSISLNARQASPKIFTVDEFKAEFTKVPCKDEERLNAVKVLFERLGAPEPEISIEKFKGVDNLVIIKKGDTSEKIVIGAHYDKVSDGCGAVDNWTGIVTLAYLYATLRNITLRKTVVFVAFGKEEKGLVGSRAMVEAIEKDQLEQYCAMVNVDSLGLSAPQVLDNASSKNLRELAASLAKEMKIPFSHANIGAADSDSSSFLRKKIPALTIHGLNNEWASIIHSRNDQLQKVNPVSVYLGYRLTLAMVARLDASACNAFR
jgi:hypothetical protein